MTLAWLGASAAAHAAEGGRTVCKKISVRTQLDSAVRHRRNHARASGRNQPCLSKPSLKTGCRLWRMRICTALRRGGAPSLTDSGGLHGWILLLKAAADPPQPWSGPAPTQILAVSNPWTPRCIRCCVATGASHLLKNQVGVSKAILRSRNTATLPQRR